MKLKEYLKKLLSRPTIYIIIGIVILLWINEVFGFTPLYFLFYIIASTIITSLIALFAESVRYLYKKSSGKKIYQIPLTIFLILLGIFILQGASINKYKPGSYFEKYDTAEEAKEALPKIHPIGSDVRALVKTIEGAGGILFPKWRSGNNKQYYYQNQNNLASLFGKQWAVSIYFSQANNLMFLKVKLYEYNYFSPNIIFSKRIFEFI